MKKGFTLIELLIVMVLVGVLVPIVLPKYYISMARGRALEGINNLRAASDFVNTRYIINGNSYPSYSAAEKITGDFTKSVYFSDPTVKSGSATSVVITLSRKSGEYALDATNTNGDLTEMTCIPASGTELADNQKLCENIGFELSGESYVMRFN